MTSTERNHTTIVLTIRTPAGMRTMSLS